MRAPMRGRSLITFIFLCISGILLSNISGGGVTFSPRAVILNFSSGIQRLFYGLGSGVTNTIQSVSQLRQLQSDYQSLLAEIESYQRMIGSIDRLEEENRRLREQLGYGRRFMYNAIGAQVIARESSPVFDGMVINRGSRSGVREGSGVVAYAGGQEGLVGRVLTVSANSSVVLPIFSNNSFFSARLSVSRHDGLLEGQGSVFSNLVMRYVDPRARNVIAYGDTVLTSGLSPQIPGDVRIGYVRRVSSPPFEPALELEIEPAIDFTRIEFVFVLLPAEESE